MIEPYIRKIIFVDDSFLEDLRHRSISGYQQFEAPDKDLVWFEHSAHGPLTEEPQRYKQLLREYLALQMFTQGGFQRSLGHVLRPARGTHRLQHHGG